MARRKELATDTVDDAPQTEADLGALYEEVEKVTPSDDTIKRIAELARRQMELEDQLAELEAQHANLTKELSRVSQVDLPAALDSAGVADFKLTNGVKVILQQSLRVSTTGKYRDAINAWLEKTGRGDLIRDELKFAFKPDESKTAELLGRIADAIEADYDRKRYVNPQSFAALLREVLESGKENVPLEDLGAFEQRFVKLERPKKSA